LRNYVSNALYSLLCLTGDFVTQSASSYLINTVAPNCRSKCR